MTDPFVVFIRVVEVGAQTISAVALAIIALVLLTRRR